MRRLTLVCALAVVVPLGVLATRQASTQSPQRGKTMTAAAQPLPFGLTEAELPKVEIMYAFYSAKTGAGKQELTISGSGKVTLLMTKTAGDAPVTRTGQLDPKIVISLLDFLSDQGFLGFSDHYPPKGDPHARRVLKLSMPKQTKTVALDEPGFSAFEMVAGAVKFTAGIAVPEALNHRFFPNL